MKFEAAKPEAVEKAFNRALFAAKEQVLTDCNYFARRDQGTLIDTSRVSVDGLTLTAEWITPYAKRVYYTGTPSKQKNPNASLMWAHKAKDVFGAEWLAILNKEMKT